MLKLLTIVSCCIVVWAQNWDQQLQVDGDGKYYLYWRISEDIVVFQVEVAVRGWVGFGISPNGGMSGSDIVIGWVSDGQVTFHDRHAVGKYMPVIDKHQDWELLWSHENDTHTILRFQRQLNTCDKKEDRIIRGSTTRIIYAYSQEDPDSANSVMYHGRINRGSKSTNLQISKKVDLDPTQDLFQWDIRSPNVTIPDQSDTTYLCTVVRRPHLEGIQHIVEVVPLVKPGNERFIHHVILYECTDADEAKVEPLLEGYHDCYTEDQIPKFSFCFTVTAGWAIGGVPLYLPEHVGLPLGRTNAIYYVLEVHYDNPGYERGIIDNSGLRIIYTPKLRKYDGGVIAFGNLWYGCMFIPPHQKNFIVSGHAHPACLKQGIPSGGIKVFSVLLHSHTAGKKLVVRHFRGTEELPPISFDDSYDFNYQNYVLLSEEHKILPNDHIIVECTYDTTERKETTFGGLSIHHEMCIAFLMYYPEISISVSASCPSPVNLVKVLGVNQISDDDRYVISPFTGNNESYIDFLNSYPWDDNSINEVQNTMKYSPHINFCSERGGKLKLVFTLSMYPKTVKVYQEPDECATRTPREDRLNPNDENREPVSQILPSYVLEKIKDE